MRIRDCPRREGADCVRSIEEANDLLRASVTVSGVVALGMAAVVGPTGTLIDSALALPTLRYCSGLAIPWIHRTKHDGSALSGARGNQWHSKANDTGLPQFIPHNNERVRCAWVSPLFVRHTNHRVVEDPYSKPSIHVLPVIGRGGVTCLTVHRVKEMCKDTSPCPEGLVI
jgi:hypothetical protein